MRITRYIITEANRQEIKRKQQIANQNNNDVYVKRKSLLTPIEKQCFKSIKTAIKDSEYLVYPQVNLATIIYKQSGGYAGELFRNIDFCLFNKYTLEPILLIELNDSSHDIYNRIERDEKVKFILQKCKIPLLTLFTTFVDKPEQIKRLINYKLMEYK